MADNGFPAEKRRSPVQAIRAYCVYCVGDGAPRECTMKACPLFVFRTGHDPARRGHPGNPESLEKNRSRAAVNDPEVNASPKADS